MYSLHSIFSNLLVDVVLRLKQIKPRIRDSSEGVYF